MSGTYQISENNEKRLNLEETQKKRAGLIRYLDRDKTVKRYTKIVDREYTEVEAWCMGLAKVREDKHMLHHLVYQDKLAELSRVLVKSG